MSGIQRLEPFLRRYPLIATAAYFGLLVLFTWTIVGRVLDIVEQRNVLHSAAITLQQFETRGLRRASVSPSSDVSVPDGSPFLDGATVTVAGAALLQRVASATTKARGNILSSQVDVQGSQSKAGFVTATTSFEVSAPFLQSLLYDLEAGMPFLFVDQIVIQGSSTAATAEDGKLRVLLSVSGQWGGGKSK
jgi:general secretion pathway protein M